MNTHHYSLTEIENMLPWEREIYIALLMEVLKEEQERERQIQSRMGK